MSRNKRGHVNHGDLQFQNLRILVSDFFWLSDFCLCMWLFSFTKKIKWNDQNTNFHYSRVPDCPQMMMIDVCILTASAEGST